jgi:ABC-type transporter Mla subunit MlaD
MRKLRALVLLVVVASLVWLAARYMVHRGELKATILFHSADALRKGDRVVEGEAVIGRVTNVARLDAEDAVTVRIDREHRRSIVSDSLFRIDEHTLYVTNTVAVGAPVEDGAVLKAREDRAATWLAKHAGSLASMVSNIKRAADEQLDRIDADHIDAALDRWKDAAPDWKKEGEEAFNRKIDVIKERVEKIEDDLRNSQRAEEADRLKEKFSRWLDEVRQ